MNLLSFIYLLLAASAQLQDFDTMVNVSKVYLQQKAGQLKAVSMPFQFNHVSQIDIDVAINQQDNTHAILCRPKDVGLAVKELDYYYYEGWRFPRDIISDYEDLLRAHSILDMVIWNSKIYLCVASGQVKVFRVDNNNGVQSIHLEDKIDIEKVSEKEPLEDGNFVHTPEIIMFVSSRMVFAIQHNKISIVEDYNRSPNFEQAYLSRKHNMLIVAQGSDGIAAYKLGNPLTLITVLNSSEIHHFTSIDGDEQDIYVTDRLSGVRKLEIKDQEMTLGQLLHKQVDCQNLIVTPEYFYINCPQITRICRQTGQVFKFANSLFEIRNLAVKGEFLLASGENLVKTYVNNYQISYFQDFELDKVILDSDRIYIATDIGIEYASWKLSNGNIICGLPSYDVARTYLEGKYLTTVHIYAACNQDYMASVNLSMPDLSKYGRCVYHIPLEIELWEGQPADTFFVKLFGGMFIVSLTVYLVIVYLSKRRIAMISQRFNSHMQALRQKGPGYNNMIEQREADVVSSAISRKTEENDVPQAKNDSYEIGD